MPHDPDGLLLPTLSARKLGQLVVLVGKPHRPFADEDWNRYIAWLKELQAATPRLNVLTVAGNHPPSATQRSVATRELDTARLRVAVLLSNPKLVVVVRALSWFIRGTMAFRVDDVDKALDFLGEGDPKSVRELIRQLAEAQSA